MRREEMGIGSVTNDYQQLIRDSILNNEDFIKATFSGQPRNRAVAWMKVIVQPVLVRGQKHMQFSYFDVKKDITKNYRGDEIAEKLAQILALEFKNVHVQMAHNTIDITITNKGKALIGNAYLTFVFYYYLNCVLNIQIRLTGIDVNGELLRGHAEKSSSLGWSGLTFQMTSIIDFKPVTAPDIVLALHACDTATDEAVAQGIRWQSKLIISAPCCQHHLQEQLDHQPTPHPFEPVERHNILKERLGDILTDTFRALILRIMGYQTDVVQFVSSEHTTKNLMIRAVKSLKVGDPKFVQEYKDLKDFWKVTPYLEQLLGEDFTKLLR